MINIEIENLSFAYNKKNPIFKDLNLSLLSDVNTRSNGNVYAVMGISGSGKSTFLKLIANIETPISGRIVITPNSYNVTYLPQEPVLFEQLNRMENAKYYSYINKMKKYYSEEIFLDMAEKLKIMDVLHSKASVMKMSGGERQRLALLRALSVKPNILLLDEPCTGLDISVKVQFLNIIKRIAKELALMILYVTHHRDEAELIADKIIYLKREGEEHVKTILSDLEIFRRIPPTVESSFIINGVGLSRINCKISNNVVKSTNGQLMGRLLTNNNNKLDGYFQIIFDEKNIKRDSQNGISVREIGSSEMHTFFIIDENDNSMLLCPNSFHNVDKVKIHGDILIYDYNGQNPIIATFEANDIKS